MAVKGKPEALDVPFCQHHCCVKSDNGEHSCDVQDLLNHPFAHLCAEKVKLCGIIPWHHCAVITMIYVAGITSQVINPLEGDSRIGTVPVTIFKIDSVTGVVAEVWAIIGIIIVGRCVCREKPVRIVSYKLGIHCGMVGDHVACKTNPALFCPVHKVQIPFIAADILRNIIFFKSIS